MSVDGRNNNPDRGVGAGSRDAKLKVIVVAFVLLALVVLLLAFPTSTPAIWVDWLVGSIPSGGGIAHPIREQLAGVTCAIIGVFLLYYQWSKILASSTPASRTAAEWTFSAAGSRGGMRDIEKPCSTLQTD